MTTKRVHRRIGVALGSAAAVLVAGAIMAAPQPGESGRQGSQPRHGEGKTPGHIMLTPEQMRWKEGPDSLPPGAQMAVLEGDLKSEGPFTIRLKVPAGYRIGPHTHPKIEHVTVISGAFHMGLGSRMDTSNGTELPTGGFAVMEPGVQHYAWAEEEAIVQLHGTGPWGIDYVNPADDPRNEE